MIQKKAQGQRQKKKKMEDHIALQLAHIRMGQFDQLTKVHA